jgi:hypothetical protein
MTPERDLVLSREPHVSDFSGGSPLGTMVARFRKEIASTMCNKILVCSADNFLERLAPFTPDDGWIKNTLSRLEEKRLLGPPARRTRTAIAPNRRQTRTSDRARESAVAEVGVDEMYMLSYS